MGVECEGVGVGTLREALQWLRQDLVQRGQLEHHSRIRLCVLLRDPINMFLLTLRLKEWTVNARVFFAVRMIVSLLFRFYSLRLCYSIPPNVFGPGLALVHYGPIVINGAVRIGKNCRCHVGVNIGANGYLDNVAVQGEQVTPKIGNNCYIGPGVKIYGPICLGNRVAIGANSVVNKSFRENGVTLGGIPACVISKKGSDGMIVGTRLAADKVPTI